MKCNQIFSLLQLTDTETATYTIQNIIVASDFENASRISRAFYGSDAIAIDTTLYPVAIGNTYKEGVFYDANGNAIERNPTEAEQIAELEAEIVSMNAYQLEQDEMILTNDYNILLLQEGIAE